MRCISYESHTTTKSCFTIRNFICKCFRFIFLFVLLLSVLEVVMRCRFADVSICIVGKKCIFRWRMQTPQRRSAIGQINNVFFLFEQQICSFWSFCLVFLFKRNIKCFSCTSIYFMHFLVFLVCLLFRRFSICNVTMFPTPITNFDEVNTGKCLKMPENAPVTWYGRWFCHRRKNLKFDEGSVQLP